MLGWLREALRALFPTGPLRTLSCRCGMDLEMVPHPYPEKCFACGEPYVSLER